MAVYIGLFLLVVGLALSVRNADYVQFHIGLPTRERKLSAPKDRQRALNICVAVAIFLLLAGVSAARKAVGNDYWVYRYQFNLIMQNRHVSYEPGFNFVVWVLQSLFGYDCYFPVFAFFSIATAVFRAITIIVVKVVCLSSAESSSPVTRLSEMEQMARARLPSVPCSRRQKFLPA